MIIRTQAHARAGLIGNPSDGYFGKTISFIVKNFAAEVVCYESPRLAIVPGHKDHLVFNSRAALVEDVSLNGYYGGIRLIKAAIKAFSDYCQNNDIELADKNFTLEYKTNVPVRVGLAGSSAIITATMRALMAFYEVEVFKPELPNLILSVEKKELGIGAGLQDRVVQVYEGTVFMDFDQQLLEERGYGTYLELETNKLPPLYVAFHDNLSEGTEIFHNKLRSRFDRGEKAVLDGMKHFASLADESYNLIQAGKGGEIGKLMDENFDLRASLTRISDGNISLVNAGRKHGANVKFAGSGGAVVGMYDGDPDRLAVIEAEYKKLGAVLLVPQIN